MVELPLVVNMSVSGDTNYDLTVDDGEEVTLSTEMGVELASGISNRARNLLKYILERVAYTETGMQAYVDALYQALAEEGGGGEPTSYMIINALTNVTTNNDATSINEGESYTATLTADTDYTIDTVTVTMGGTDITSTDYDSSTGTITIASVTGDINITASASIPVATTYTITNILTNVSSNNSASSITENNSYTATLTANSGYEISTVTIMMGGTDITSSAYSNGVITISSVTGDVVITASASIQTQSISFELGAIGTDGTESDNSARARSGSIAIVIPTPTLSDTVRVVVSAIDSTLGTINEKSTNRITSQTIPVTGGASFTATCSSGYYMKAFEYANTGYLTNIFIGDFTSNSISGTINGNATFVRLVLKKADNTDITDSELSSLGLTINGVSYSTAKGDISIGFTLRANATVNGTVASYIPRLFRNGTIVATPYSNCYDTAPAYSTNDSSNTNSLYLVSGFMAGDNTEYAFNTLPLNTDGIRFVFRDTQGNDITSMAGSIFINDTEYAISFN